MTTTSTDFDTLTPTTDAPLLVKNGVVHGVTDGCTFAKKDGVTHVCVTRDTRIIILADRPHDSQLYFTIERDVSLALTHIAIADGGTHRVTFDLVGRGASIACATFLATMAATTRYTFTTRHRAPQTMSLERARCIAGGTGRIEWYGHVSVPHSAPDCRVRQDNKNLLLADTAMIIAKPELDIEIDAVEASHGSATGALDETALLYLGARGIKTDDAKRLLTLAFAETVFGALPSAIRDLVMARFSEKMKLI